MQEMIRINVGCGQTPTPGWRNFDNSPSLRLVHIRWLPRRLPRLLCRLGMIQEFQCRFMEFAQSHDIAYGDAAKHLPLADHVADTLYSSHMLEHLDRDGAACFLREAQRVLRPGGILRLLVPDLQVLVKSYLADGDADMFLKRTLLCQPPSRSWVQRLRFLAAGPRHHQWMYDGRSLCALLEQQGFIRPSIMPAGTTRIRAPGALDLVERNDESVCVEAEAP